MVGFLKVINGQPLLELQQVGVSELLDPARKYLLVCKQRGPFSRSSPLVALPPMVLERNPSLVMRHCAFHGGREINKVEEPLPPPHRISQFHLWLLLQLEKKTWKNVLKQIYNCGTLSIEAWYWQQHGDHVVKD